MVDKHKGSVTIGGGPMDQSGGGNTIKNILEGVHDVWDEEQYGGEYDMNKFMKSLATTKDN